MLRKWTRKQNVRGGILSNVVGQSGDVRLEPRSTCADNANAVDFSAPDTRSEPDQALSLSRIDNPHRTTFNSVDCVSCHKATRLATEAGLPAKTADAFVAPAGTTGAFQTGFFDEGIDHFRAFGWHDDASASVSLVRFTVNDSAAVAKRLSQP